jgi:glycosyltransferase involved in cell wall biosynthesis
MNWNESVPLVSIILPTYNRASLLPRSIGSVLSQTYQNFELIVVDDFSTDNTEIVVKSFKDQRIRYIQHEKNKGAVAARNTGIVAAKGQYIAFQDSDDEWLPSKLEKQMKIFFSAPKDVGVIYTDYWLIENGVKIFSRNLNHPVKEMEDNIHRSFLRVNFVNLPTAIVKMECFQKAGLFEELPRLQEWGLWLRISKYYNFKSTNEPLLNAYRQTDSISHNEEANIKARKYLLAKYFKEISTDKKLLRNHYYEIGTLLCLNRRIGEGRSYFVKALKTNPFHYKLLFSTISTLFGQRFYNLISEIYLSALDPAAKV